MAELLRGLQDILWRFCLSQLRDPVAAEEAVQETATRLIAAVSRFEGRSTAKTWALGVALNVCRECRRRRQRACVDEFPEPVDHRPLPETRAHQAEQEDAVREALAGLPSRQREAIVLRYFEQMSVEEAASAMGCAAGTVKASVWQGLRALRRAMGKQGATEPAREQK